MNRGGLLSALQARLRIPATGSGLMTPTSQVDCLNLALADIVTAGDWPWLLTSASLTFTSGVASTEGFAAPINRIREVTINGRRAKHATSLAEFLDAIADGDRNVWFEIGATINLAPIPSGTQPAGVLFYLQPEPALAADATYPLLPAQYHAVLVARAAYHANIRQGLLESAAQDNGEYEAGLKKMRDASVMRNGPRAVRSVGSTEWATW